MSLPLLIQSSALGAFLDVCIDNTTRQLMWAKALGDHWIGAAVPALEWLVFACTHSQVALSALPWASCSQPCSIVAERLFRTPVLPHVRGQGEHFMSGLLPIDLQTVSSARKLSRGPGADQAAVGELQKPKDWREGFQRAPWWVSRVMFNGFKK